MRARSCVLAATVFLGACAGLDPVTTGNLVNLGVSLGHASASGDAFAPTEIPAGRSAIYVYRGSQFSVLEIPVRLNGDPWVQLQTGGYAVAIVAPGRHEIAFPERLPPLAAPNRADTIRNTPEKKMFVDVPAGASAYVKGETRRGFGQPNWEDIFVYFTQPDPAAAKAEVSATRRSAVPRNH